MVLSLIGCGRDNGDVSVHAQPLPPYPTKDVELKIKASLDKALILNASKQIQQNKLTADYPLLASSAEDGINLLPATKVWLYYDGLPSGGIWNKPGAKAFDGKLIATVDFSSGPVPALLVAHKALEGDRNYFYVKLVNGTQGWVGRPYVSKAKSGREFFMPNPLTGEQVRTSLQIDAKYISKQIKIFPERYIPSYEQIDWAPEIPEIYRRQGYETYRSAIRDGYNRVDEIVNQYLLEIN